jgi:ankyrin repeat protein
LASAVSLILETAADPNVSCDAYGGSPLEIASHLGHEAVVRELLAKGANPNRLGNNNHGSALQRAVFGGYEGIIHTLLAAGADPNLTPSSAEPTTPIQAALSMGHEHIAILLLNHAADPDTHCGKYGSALQVSLMLDSAAVMQHLLAKGANPNLNNGQYGTALQIAAERGNVQAVRALLGKGACPSAYNTKFDSPLGQALYYSHADIIDLLLKAGAYLQPRECGRALEIAAYVGDQSMVRALLGNGLDVDCSCRGNYETALWMAASQGHVGIVRLLLTKPPACGIADEFLGLARESAAGGRHYDIVFLLEVAR